MLLMLADEMKFVSESISGQRGSFCDVPLLGLFFIHAQICDISNIRLCFIYTLNIYTFSAVFYMVQMLIISIATCTSSMFVYLEHYALRNQYIEVNAFGFLS